MATKPKVYLETTVISYLTARPTKDVVALAHQRLTRAWWLHVLPLCEPHVSQFVLQEVARGDPEAARRRLERIATFPVLSFTDEVRALGDEYFRRLRLPEKARADAYHLALATWHGIDYLLSWNFTHIVNGPVRVLLSSINDGFELESPCICTPEELMEV